MSDTTEAVTEAPQSSAPIPPPSPKTTPGRAWLAEKERTIPMKGNKQYLQVPDRVYAWRLDHPAEEGWGIATELKAGSFPENWVLWECRITDPLGRVVGVGHKQENPPADIRGCQEWVDKGETQAIGRALSCVGYGTLLALEEAEDSVCDAPRERPQSRPPQQQAPRPLPPKPPAAAPKPAPKAAEPAADAPNCVVCEKPITDIGRARFCQAKGLPPSCQDKACANDPKAQKKG